MATKKKSTGAAYQKGDAVTATMVSEAYEKATARFGEAVGLLHQAQYDAARAIFDEIAADDLDEPVLVERARSYGTICSIKMTEAPPAPTNSEDCYLRGVVKANEGEFDESIRLLDQAIAEQPNSAKFLYARASAFALKGNVDAAIGDLRQAIAAEPTTRFHAVNDPDFEQIREEPAFIDIIEPTPSGA